MSEGKAPTAHQLDEAMARILDVAIRIRSGLAPGDPVQPEEAPLAEALLKMSKDLDHIALDTGTKRRLRLRDIRSLRAFEHLVELVDAVKFDAELDRLYWPNRDRQADDIEEVRVALQLHGFAAKDEDIRGVFQKSYESDPRSLDDLRKDEKPSGAAFAIIERVGGTGRETLKTLKRLLFDPAGSLALKKHADEHEKYGPSGETVWKAVAAAVASVSPDAALHSRPRSAWTVEVTEPEGIIHSPPRPLPPFKGPATGPDQLPPASPPGAPKPPGT